MMTVYSFFIFDRHAECIYQKRWAETKQLTATKLADDAKLLFGVVFSLRNIVRRLGGSDDDFIHYTTGEYKLHYYETPTSLKFCMMTDLQTVGNIRVVLHQIWVNLYVEYVVRNPLSPVEHPGGVGVDNELFEMGLERFVEKVVN